MAPEDHVEHPRLQREEPAAEHRQFLFGPQAGRAQVSTRIRLADSQKIVAIARLSDGTFWSASVDVVVTLDRLHRGAGVMASALINVPAKAKRGEIIEIKTLMSHIMETGYRHTATGEVIPRDIITSFICRFNGNEIFRADLFPAISANPFFTFFTTATESGKFEFEWIGDKGFTETASAAITVE